MSHFTCLVIGGNIENQLAPFDEAIEVPEYSNGAVSQEDLDNMVEYYKKNGIEFQTFDELYAAKGNDWNGNAWRKGTDTWQSYSTYNPKSKWDWYELGGRWAGRIKVKEGVEYEEPNFSYGWDEPSKQEVLAERRTDNALIKDIENLDELTTFSVLKDGVWYERGEMGWWGISINDKDEDEWNNELKKLLSGLPDNTLISIIDCHI
jgi:hypothetical protein